MYTSTLGLWFLAAAASAEGDTLPGNRLSNDGR